MGRPSRTPDLEIIAQLCDHMAGSRLSMGEVAARLGVSKATVSRSVAARAVSPDFRTKIVRLVTDPANKKVPELLRQSLRLLEHSDRLRLEAEQMLAEALDRTTAKE